uniref:Probable chitinase 3 n=1 Tax=Cacopsylla melanoneura TaxID=428564 RepID=A0A8D8MDQ8_9HEMI
MNLIYTGLFLVTCITIFKGTDAVSDPITPGCRKVCYFTNWASNDTNTPYSAAFTPEDIDFSLCNFIVYADFGLDETNLTIRSRDPKTDFGTNGGLDLISRVITAANASNTPVLATVGGAGEDCRQLSIISTNETVQDAFVKQAVEFLTQYGFRGLVLDYEYPQRIDDGIKDIIKPGDDEKVGFSKLIQKLRLEFDKHNFYLVATVDIDIEHIDTYYEPKILNDNLDWLELLTYDYHTPNEDTIGLVAPLIPYVNENATNNVKASVEAWLNKGIAPGKLVIGVPFYGVSYKLDSKTNHGIGAHASDVGLKEGTVFYHEICELKAQGWTVVNSENGTPIGGSYAFHEDMWVGFDDVTDVQAKAQYIREKQLAGFAAFALDGDDYKGSKCGVGKYPLLSALSKDVNSAAPKSHDTPLTITTGASGSEDTLTTTTAAGAEDILTTTTAAPGSQE